MDFLEKQYRCSDLVCGYENGVIGFRHKPYHLRSVRERSRYDALRKHLAENGMLNPIITWRGHVLIGQRRFEIWREDHDTIEALEIDDDLARWGHPQVSNLKKTVARIYNLRTPKLPRGL